MGNTIRINFIKLCENPNDAILREFKFSNLPVVRLTAYLLLLALGVWLCVCMCVCVLHSADSPLNAIFENSALLVYINREAMI